MLSSKSGENEGQRGVVGQLLRLSWPIAVSMLSYSLMTAVDTLFVGRSGAVAIAAVGLGGMVSFTLLTFAMGLLRGGKVIVAHSFGSGDFEKTTETARTNVALAILLSGLTLAVTLASAPLLRLVFDDPRAGQLVVSYVVVRAAAIPFFLVACAIREVSQGIGDSEHPMRAALAANLANIPLNALLVIGLHLGVVGSAVANVLAQIIDLLWLCRKRWNWVRGWRIEWVKIRAIVKLGWPLGIEMFLDVSAFAALGMIIAQFGATELAAHQIALQVSHLTLLPVMALAEGASVLSGHASGAGRLADIRPIVRAGVAVGLVFSTVTACLLVTVPGSIAEFFTSDPKVIPLAKLLIQMVCGFQLGFVLYAVGRAVLRGLGDLRYTAFVTVGVAWICTPTLGFVFGRLCGFGVVGGWCGLSLEITVASALYFWRLERGTWSRAALGVRVMGLDLSDTRPVVDLESPVLNVANES
jgi:MATE family multidrug resistance protein